MVHPDKKVLEVIGQGLSHTITLSFIAMVCVLVGAFIVSLIAIYYRDTWIETLIDQAMIAMLSLPSLFWGPLLIYIFAVYFEWLPVAFLSSPVHYVLPVMTMVFRPLSVLSRLLKNSLVENLNADYVRTAQAKGLSHFRILFRHVLRNSMIPI